jgi:hypothetical protein
MSSRTAQRVLDAAAAMEWVPEGAIELRTDDYRLIRYPDAVLDPTFRAAQVTWSRTARALEEILDEVAVHMAREHGATLALVKGRVLTSAPILLRAGFADYGEERCYWLPIG